MALTAKQQRGQFFTTTQKVQQAMVDLITADPVTALAFEPSAGSGHLVKTLEDKGYHNIDAVEIDETLDTVCQSEITNQDFFTYADARNNDNGTYDVIFGNPPYVAWKHIEDATRQSAATVKSRYSDKTNLYHLFIDRCIDLLKENGEMVLIVPKEWLYSSSAAPLRTKMYNSGSITHLIDCGEEKLFDDADVPALLIFRYTKGVTQSSIKFAANLTAAVDDNWETRNLVSTGHRWMLLTPELASKTQNWGKLGDRFSVKVGMVSGADGIFRISATADIEEEATRTYLTTKGLERFIDVNHIQEFSDIPPKAAAYLLEHKEALIKRKIASFNESNWWKYGAVRNALAMNSSISRIYAYGRTRNPQPFFINEQDSLFFSGGILGLFAKDEKENLEEVTSFLNSADFREIMEAMFLATGNKISLQPSTLEDAPFPPAK